MSEKAKHTPEPWWMDAHAPFQTDAGDDFWPINAGQFDSTDERRIADVYESETAARLMVAAPEMLALLREIADPVNGQYLVLRAEIDTPHKDHGWSRVQWAEKARALLAKIDGEE